MSVTREEFERGLTYDEYKAQMTRSKERFEQIEANFNPPAEIVETLRRLPEPLNVVVIAEDWCGDVINNMPLLGKLAKASGKLNLRCYLRDQNEDLMNRYLNQGKFKSIPVFAFFDRDMRQIGVFIERPDTVTAERSRRRAELYAQNPDFGDPSQLIDTLPDAVRERLQSALMKQREELADWSNAEVVRELQQIIAGTTART